MRPEVYNKNFNVVRRYLTIKTKRASMTPNYSILYVYSYITLCKKIFKVVYRQVFCKCVRLMQHVLYYSTTSNWSVCKSVYIILATTTTTWIICELYTSTTLHRSSCTHCIVVCPLVNKYPTIVAACFKLRDVWRWALSGFVTYDHDLNWLYDHKNTGFQEKSKMKVFLKVSVIIKNG